MYKYEDLGLVNTNEMFKDAYKNNYAVPAFVFISIEQLNAIIDAAIAKESPVIMLASPNLLEQIGKEMVANLAKAAVERVANSGKKIPLVLHLDHGKSFEQCVEAIDSGFSSVMIDGSTLPFEENIALTKKVVDYAHKRNVTVEGELGVFSGAEESLYDESKAEAEYTDPAMVKEFVEKTGVDSLAISIGTNHGLVKMQPKADGTLPELRFDILQEVERILPNFPIVLHGASTIEQKYVDMINQYGGEIKKSIGTPEDQVAKAVKMAICKVNIATDGWIAALALTRKILSENKSAIDSRIFTLEVRKLLKEIYEHKIELLGSANRI
ncbi:MAG: ketose-bisphosphate aldolase [Bacteroidia bacterium]|nr:ketose-bisphosphate aldolase [Bacteroidia bacterium]